MAYFSLTAKTKSGLELFGRALIVAVAVGCVVAVGKPAEQIELVPVHEGDTLTYYRRDGIHYVPKLTAEDLTIK